MLAKSHISLGLLGGICAYPLAQKCGITKDFYLTLLLPLILLGSLLPDIDEPKSFIGRKFPLIARIFSISFSHRGFTHFLIFPLIFVGIAVIVAHNVISPCIFALSYGIFLHQIGDMLTISGIPHYFFPISRQKAILLPQFLRFRTGSFIEKIILIFILTPLITFSAFAIFGDEANQILNLQNLQEIHKFLSKISDF